jgi:hypothetical protein
LLSPQHASLVSSNFSLFFHQSFCGWAAHVSQGDNVLAPYISTEVRAEEWETLNHKCHSVFGASPECVPPEKDLMEVQSRTLMEVLIFVNIQKDSFSGLAKHWLYRGEPDFTGILLLFLY